MEEETIANRKDYHQCVCGYAREAVQTTCFLGEEKYKANQQNCIRIKEEMT